MYTQAIPIKVGAYTVRIDEDRRERVYHDAGRSGREVKENEDHMSRYRLRTSARIYFLDKYRASLHERRKARGDEARHPERRWTRGVDCFVCRGKKLERRTREHHTLRSYSRGLPDSVSERQPNEQGRQRGRKGAWSLLENPSLSSNSCLPLLGCMYSDTLTKEASGMTTSTTRKLRAKKKERSGR